MAHKQLHTTKIWVQSQITQLALVNKAEDTENWDPKDGRHW